MVGEIDVERALEVEARAEVQGFSGFSWPPRLSGAGPRWGESQQGKRPGG